MYPLTLIRFSNKQNISLELKDGQTVTGHLVKCDVAMNMHLTNVIVSRTDGTEYSAKCCFLRGLNVRMVKIQPWVMSKQHLFD